MSPPDFTPEQQYDWNIIDDKMIKDPKTQGRYYDQLRHGRFWKGSPTYGPTSVIPKIDPKNDM
jgi:hypothetical protein